MPRCFAWLLWVFSLHLSLSDSSAESRPNLVVLVADDLRWNALGFAGNKFIQTPHVDQLARQGVVFRNSFVTTSICAVSRASIFSGQYARRHGINDFATPFTTNQWSECYPELLRRAGYRLGFIGKFGVGNTAPTNTFEYWDGFNGQGRYFDPGDNVHLTHKMGESALRFLDMNDTRPFCLSISFKAPHAQDGAAHEFQPDPRDQNLYAESTFPTGPSVNETAHQKLPAFLQNSEGRTRWKRRFATEEMRDRTLRDYYRLITGIDREIGRIRSRLKELGLDKNTILVFTSDNGFFLGEHGLAGKWFMQEESIRVPLVILDPRNNNAPGKTVEAIALNVDIAPTLLDFAGITPPAEMQGRSLRSWIQGSRPRDWRRDFYYEHHFSNQGTIPDSEGVRGERWKYIRYTMSEPVVEQLFDLKKDPCELRDLAGKPRQARRLEKLRKRWEQFRTELE